MKRFLLIILTAAVLFSALPPAIAAAETVSYPVTDEVTITIDKTNKTITFSGTGPIPDCNSSGNPLWAGSPYAETVFIEAGITAIGKFAFYNNENIKTVFVGDTVKSIGNSAFARCRNMTRFEMGGELEQIGDEAFSGCVSLTSFFFPYTLKYLGRSAFARCTRLNGIELPDGIEFIYADAFIDTAYYNSLTNGIHTLCGYTLEYKGSVNNSTVSIPEDARVISARTLVGSTYAKRLVIPDGVETILYEAFYDLPEITEVTVPDSVTHIGEFALGYKNGTENYVPYAIPGFRILGHGGTDAERYAAECRFEFECMCEEGPYIFYPDCLTGGEAVVGCKYCGRELYTVDVPRADSHTFGTRQMTPATCTEPGETFLLCELCGYKKVLGKINPTGHTPCETPVFTPPTCTENGVVTYYCTVCGAVCGDSYYLAAPGHVASDDVEIIREATCTESGVGAVRCAVCGEVLETTVIPPSGHVKSEEWTVLIKSDPEHGIKGLQVRLCAVCGIAVEYEYYLAGDLDGDDEIGVTDLIVLKKIISGSAEMSSEALSDVDGDGETGISDIITLKHLIAGS